MEISFARVKEILDTLPIGYYCGRRVTNSLAKDEEASYYIPMEDKIVVSYEQVITGLENIKAEQEIEISVRCLLYHELSHAILTPRNISDVYQRRHSFHMPWEVVNIYEDERIERLMDGYYHNVDFFANTLKINNYQTDFDPKHTDAISAFYHAVRYRQDIGIPNFQSKLEYCLYSDRMCNANSSLYDTEPMLSHIYALYQRVVQKYGNPNQQQQNGQSQGQGNESEQEQQQSNGMSNPSASSQQSNPAQKGQSLPNPNDAYQKPTSSTQEDNETNEDSEGQSQESGNSTPTQMDKQSRDAMTDYVQSILSFGKNTSSTGNWYATLDRIFANFHKKNKNGNGISAYSGVFNPRSVARKDFRYFDKPVVANGNNKFGTCHLNMFIDCSGSFEDNQDIVNQLIQTLCQLERKHKNFSLDICFLGDGEHYVTDYKDKELIANEGTELDEDAISIFRSLQKPNTFNYNIVLLDGYAYNQLGRCMEAQRLFEKSFDHENTTCILNECEYLTRNFSKAKVVNTTRYTQNLFDNVVKALTVAFG